MQVDKSEETVNQEMSGCEATLHQILRILSQDDLSMHLNSQDKDALISSLLQNSQRGIEENVLPQHSRPRPVSHAQRLQQTEAITRKCVTDNDEEAPLLSIKREQKPSKYETFGSYKKRSIPRLTITI